MPEQGQEIPEEVQKENQGNEEATLHYKDALKLVKEEYYSALVPTERVFCAIRKMRKYQDVKWGDQSIKLNGQWYTILLEEAGEVAKALNDHNLSIISPKDLMHSRRVKEKKAIEELRAELIDVAAVAVAWLEALE